MTRRAGRDASARCIGRRRRRRLPGRHGLRPGVRRRTRATAVARLYALKGRPPDKPAAVMFFDLELALAALPELGPRTRARSSAAARRRDAAAAQPARGASRSRAGPTRRRSGCASRPARRAAALAPCAGRCCSPAPTAPAARTRGGSTTSREAIRAGADLRARRRRAARARRRRSSTCALRGATARGAIAAARARSPSAHEVARRPEPAVGRGAATVGVAMTDLPARLLRSPARRRRPRGRRGHRPRARAPAAHARDDRLGELRARRPSSSARAAC